MLANIDPIQQGDGATPNLWNSRFGELTKVVNGNIDTDNLKNRGVAREKIALEAVGSDELAPQTILPSHVNNVWIGKSSGVTNIGTSWSTRFNKTISLPEAAYVYVLWTARGNANTTTVDPGIRILINDTAVYTLEGGVGLELMTAKLHADMTFSIAGMGDSKYSGNVNVKIQTKSSKSNGWDCGSGWVRIDALGDGTYLG